MQNPASTETSSVGSRRTVTSTLSDAPKGWPTYRTTAGVSAKGSQPWKRLEALVRWLGNAHFRREVPLGAGIRALEFSRDGRPITMVWADRRQRVRLRVDRQPVVRGLMGNDQTQWCWRDGNTLSAGRAPVLLIGASVSARAEVGVGEGTEGN